MCRSARVPANVFVTPRRQATGAPEPSGSEAVAWEANGAVTGLLPWGAVGTLRDNSAVKLRWPRNLPGTDYGMGHKSNQALGRKLLPRPACPCAERRVGPREQSQRDLTKRLTGAWCSLVCS